ncbi:MAG: hypothetical protein OCC49_01135 [Fibrobacterales bacterium]
MTLLTNNSYAQSGSLVFDGTYGFSKELFPISIGNIKVKTPVGKAYEALQEDNEFHYQLHLHGYYFPFDHLGVGASYFSSQSSSNSVGMDSIGYIQTSWNHTRYVEHTLFIGLVSARYSNEIGASQIDVGLGVTQLSVNGVYKMNSEGSFMSVNAHILRATEKKSFTLLLVYSKAFHIYSKIALVLKAQLIYSDFGKINFPIVNLDVEGNPEVDDSGEGEENDSVKYTYLQGNLSAGLRVQF